MKWIKEVFKTEKPIVAMCHLQALPGDPAYDAKGGMAKIVEMARQDFRCRKAEWMRECFRTNSACRTLRRSNRRRRLQWQELSEN